MEDRDDGGVGKTSVLPFLVDVVAETETTKVEREGDETAQHRC